MANLASNDAPSSALTSQKDTSSICTLSCPNFRPQTCAPISRTPGCSTHGVLAPRFAAAGSSRGRAGAFQHHFGTLKGELPLLPEKVAAQPRLCGQNAQVGFSHMRRRVSVITEHACTPALNQLLQQRPVRGEGNAQQAGCTHDGTCLHRCSQSAPAANAGSRRSAARKTDSSSAQQTPAASKTLPQYTVNERSSAPVISRARCRW